LFNQGFRNYKCVVDELDLIFCSQYGQGKPCPVPEEFIELAAILMDENGWVKPRSPEEGLLLYLYLRASIQ